MVIDGTEESYLTSATVFGVSDVITRPPTPSRAVCAGPSSNRTRADVPLYLSSTIVGREKHRCPERKTTEISLLPRPGSQGSASAVPVGNHPDQWSDKALRTVGSPPSVFISIKVRSDRSGAGNFGGILSL